MKDADTLVDIWKTIGLCILGLVFQLKRGHKAWYDKSPHRKVNSNAANIWAHLAQHRPKVNRRKDRGNWWIHLPVEKKHKKCFQPKTLNCTRHSAALKTSHFWYRKSLKVLTCMKIPISSNNIKELKYVLHCHFGVYTLEIRWLVREPTVYLWQLQRSSSCSWLCESEHPRHR